MSAVGVTKPGSRVLHEVRFNLGGHLETRCEGRPVVYMWTSREQIKRPMQDCLDCVNAARGPQPVEMPNGFLGC